MVVSIFLKLIVQLIVDDERIDHQSANIVLETCFRNENYAQFFEHLRSFLLETDEVMVVIGIIILEPRAPEMVPMVCVIYDRDHFFNPGTFHQPTILASFGTISPYESSRNAIEDAAGPFGSQYLMTGVGFSAIPDDILTIGTANHAIYVINIYAGYLLRRDNAGNELVAKPPINSTGVPIPCKMRLYDVQHFVLQRMNNL